MQETDVPLWEREDPLMSGPEKNAIKREYLLNQSPTRGSPVSWERLKQKRPY